MSREIAVGQRTSATQASSAPERFYLALIGDIVHSREIRNRDVFQKTFHETMAMLNTRYASAITSPFTVTLGDEFQALLHTASPLFEIVDDLQRHLSPHQFVLGLGVGPVETEIYTYTAVGMDGPCFRLARENVEKCKRKPPRLRVSVHQFNADVVNALFHFLEDTRAHHTPRQREVIERYRALGTQEAVARDMGISQSAVSQTLQSARYPLIETSEHAIIAFLNQFLTGDVITERRV